MQDDDMLDRPPDVWHEQARSRIAELQHAVRRKQIALDNQAAQVERLRTVARAAPDGIDAVWAAVEALHPGDLGERSSAPD